MIGGARIVGLVPAAGGGTRFGGELPKQYADLAGRPLLACTLERLFAGVRFDRVFVALAADDSHHAAALDGFAGRVDVLRCGGATRAATVRNALDLLAAELGADDWLLVHDAARPCVPVDALHRLVADLAQDSVGGLLAIPVADTLKRAGAPGDDDRNVRVTGTAERTGLWQAQTPQMFRFGVLRAALARPGSEAVTDESQAVETLAASGACAAPRLVAGSPLNVKVTYRADLALAAAIRQMQEADAGTAPLTDTDGAGAFHPGRAH